MEKAPDAFRTISEVADELDVPQHVLRFWESRFSQIKPMKRAGGRRYYRPEDLELLRGIRHLLYGQGYTIRGVQRILKEQGAKFVQAAWHEKAENDGAWRDESPDEDDDELQVDADEQDEDEVAATPLPPAIEQGGLRDRLKSLVGRDLGDAMDDAPARLDPPMHAAPFPRIDPDDRPARFAASSDNEEDAPAPKTPSGERPRGKSNGAEPAAGTGLAPEHDASLRAALEELDACRTLLEAALQDA